MTRKKRILLFEDFESILSVLEKQIAARGFELVKAKKVPDVMQQLNGTSFDLVIIDNDMKDKAAEKIIRFMRDATSYLYTPIVLLITGNRELYADTMGPYNIAMYLTKPFDMGTFNTVLDRMSR